MKSTGIVLLSFLILCFACEEKKYYVDADPRWFNDAMHGNIIGKVLQIDSKAEIIISQVHEVESVSIDPTDGSFEIQNLPIGNYDLSVRAEDFRIYKLCNVMVQGAGNTYVGEIDLSTIPDLVSSHYPENKDEIIYNNRYSRLTISIIFTQPMDRESVEKAFSTTPATEGIFHWGQYSTQPNRIYYTDMEANWGFDAGATITTYSKITSFSYQVAQKDSYMDTTYLVNLSTEAKDTAGNPLRFPLEFSFSTIQSSSTQNGILTSPSHGDVDVDLITTQGIQVTFPRNMDPVSTEGAISFFPASDIIYIWPAPNQLTIYTGGVLHADTKYDVIIDSKAKDKDGVEMGSPFHFNFKTASVNLSSTSPRNGELFVSEYEPIYLYFNTYMQKSSVQSALSISPDISGTLNWHNNSKTVLVFNPNQNFKRNTKYTVTIGTEAVDLYGSALEEPYSFSFVIRPE